MKSTSALFLVVLALGSCATPKPEVVAPPPVEKKKEEKPPEPPAPEPLLPAPPLEDARMGGMLDLPTDADFKSSSTPSAPKPGGGTGPVISRPPLDPPARVKPTAPEPE